jgi:hypothetical protein
MQRLLISSYAGLALLGPGPTAAHQPAAEPDVGWTAGWSQS